MKEKGMYTCGCQKCGCTKKVKELGAGGVGVLCTDCKNDKHFSLSTGAFVP